MTRIKEIKFNKIEKIDIINDKTEKNMTKYIATTDNKSEISDFSLDSNKYEEIPDGDSNRRQTKIKNKNQQNTCRCYKSVRLCSTSSATAFVNKFPSL